jgi:hypothetical protein
LPFACITTPSTMASTFSSSAILQNNFSAK